MNQMLVAIKVTTITTDEADLIESYLGSSVTMSKSEVRELRERVEHLSSVLQAFVIMVKHLGVRFDRILDRIFQQISQIFANL